MLVHVCRSRFQSFSCYFVITWVVRRLECFQHKYISYDVGPYLYYELRVDYLLVLDDFYFIFSIFVRPFIIFMEYKCWWCHGRMAQIINLKECDDWICEYDRWGFSTTVLIEGEGRHYRLIGGGPPGCLGGMEEPPRERRGSGAHPTPESVWNMSENFWVWDYFKALKNF